jgi:putative MATE family efflux protein
MPEIDETVLDPGLAIDERHGTWMDSIREGLRGSHRDFTRGPIGRAIVVLAIPMVLEMVMESVFAVVDIFFVIKLGADAAAAVGLTESMVTLIYALAMGLSIGAMATVARRIGEKDKEGAAHAAVQSLLLGLGVSVVLGITGIIFAPRLLALMGGNAGVVSGGANYTRVLLGGNVVIVMLFLINAIFRGAGDAAIAMRVLWLANIINIILCPCFIFGLGPFPALGVTGAAVATTIGRGIGALYAFSKLVRPGSRVDIRRQHFTIDLEVIKRLIKLSASATFQVLVGMASWIGLMRILARFGSDAVAGYTVGIRVVLFALLPSFGMSNAAATMVGQALGAGKPERAERAVWMAGFYNVCFLGVIGLLFIVFAPQIISIFTQDSAILPYGTSCLRIVSCGFIFYAYGMVLTQSFNGAGDTWTPTKINLLVFWLCEIPLAYFLAVHLGLGPKGIFLAITLAFSLLAVISAVVFKRGRWKTGVV